MQYILLGLALLLLVLLGLRTFANASPANMAQTMRNIGGSAALMAALFLAATGRFPLAIPLGFVAFSLLRGNFPSFPGGFGSFPGNANKRAGQNSRVRTRTIEMELDHDTGDMEGRVIKGRFSPQMLSSMGQRDLIGLWADCQVADNQAAQLLEAYLDRRFSDWRERAGAQPKGSGESRGGPEGPMSVDEAYEILGLQQGASSTDIRRAHRRLMKKMHPDQGGSTYLAAKINEAKDLLMG
ncbi:Dna-J like membrane chaperone protein [bacterium BMS3Bbin10]|nr:Dna-J like membrane chaperone protein [bacterium BMS3Bbin10]